MRNLTILFLAAICSLLVCVANAQARLTISGIVTNEQGEVLRSATVFLSGTQHITAADDEGKFTFTELSAGTYLVAVQMVGYTPLFQNVVIRKNRDDIKLTLKVRTTDLREVVIGGKDPKWNEKLSLFRQCFLGLSKNGRNCKIVNPKVLRLKFDYGKQTLEGKSDDFLIVENTELGYRIKYLLKLFEYKYQIGITNYDGETSFEEMDGTPQQKAIWATNRRKAYYGSAMHFFRTLYAGEQQPKAEGFMARSLRAKYELSDGEEIARIRPPAMVDAKVVAFDTLVTVIDNSFISFKFRRGLFVDYEPKGSRPRVVKLDENGMGYLPFTNDSSVLQFCSTEAVIDSRGKIMDDLPFLMMGRWGHARLGDQLPYEYQP